MRMNLGVLALNLAVLGVIGDDHPRIPDAVSEVAPSDSPVDAKLKAFAIGEGEGDAATLSEWHNANGELFTIQQDSCVVNTNAWSLNCGPTEEIKIGSPHEILMKFNGSGLQINPDNYDMIEFAFKGESDPYFTGVERYVQYLYNPDILTSSGEAGEPSLYKQSKSSDRTHGNKAILSTAGLETWPISPVESVCTWDKVCTIDLSELMYDRPGKLNTNLDLSRIVLSVLPMNKGTAIAIKSSQVELKVVKTPSEAADFCKTFLTLDCPYPYSWCWRRCVSMKRSHCFDKSGKELVTCMTKIFEVTGTAPCTAKEPLSDEACAAKNPCVEGAVCSLGFGEVSCKCQSGKGDGFKDGSGCSASHEESVSEHKF